MSETQNVKHINTLLHIDPEIKWNCDYFDNGQAELRVVRLWKDTTRPTVPLVFVPGWASTIFTWRYFLPRLLCYTSIFYFETREKSSSILCPSASFKVEDVARDVSDYLNKYYHKGTYNLIGASMGATYILECWAYLRNKPACVTLILPNIAVAVPSYLSALKYTPRRLSPYLKPFVSYLMVKFHLTPKEAEQQVGLFAAVNDGDADKLRRAGLGLGKYELDLNEIMKIDRPSLIIGASQDRLHNPDAVLKIHQSIFGSTYKDLNTFTNAHSSKSADLIINWMSSYNG